MLQESFRSAAIGTPFAFYGKWSGAVSILKKFVLIKILIIDDDESELEAMRIALESRDYAVLLASDGRAGLEMAESLQPDLVIVDLMMPPPNGFTICEQLRRTEGASRPAVMVLTGLSEKMHKAVDSADIRLRVDADDYMEKPIDPEDLFKRVDALLSRDYGGEKKS